MIDLNKFIDKISHKKGKDEEEAEKADCKGYLLDYPDGVAKALDFRTHELSYVDYFWLCNDSSKYSYTLIELSDIKDKLVQATEETKEILDTKQCKGEKKENIKMVWLPLVCEMKLKTQGSRVVIERLHHNLGHSKLNYDCEFVVVAKNLDDPIILNRFNDRLKELEERLNGMISTKVCMTQHLCRFKKGCQPQ